MRRLSLLTVSFLVACSSAPKDGGEGGRGDSEPAASQAPSTKPVTDEPERGPEPRRETPAGAYAGLSEAYKSQNDEGVYRASVQILSQNPSDPKALNAMGLYHYRKGRFLAARYFFSRAAQSNPRSSEILNNQGLVSLALGEPREAIRFFKKALDVNPNDGIAASNLGSIYVQSRDYTKAQIALEIAVRKGMREVKTLTNYGIALAGTGKPDQAKRAYEDALKLNSNSQETLLNYAILLVDHMKQYSDGLDQINRLRFLGPAPELRNRMNALENRAKAGIK